MQDAEIRICQVHSSRISYSESAAVLSAAENDRAAEYTNRHAMEQFVKTRGALRTLLAKVTGQAPRALKISSEVGKPSLLDFENIQFSVSRSSEWIAIAIGSVPLGLDLERIKDHALNASVTETLFHPAEREQLSALSGKVETSAFYNIWTQKEAFAKAIGSGVSLDFTRISVRLNGGRILAEVPTVAGLTWYSCVLDIEPQCCLALVTPLEHPKIRMISWPPEAR